MIYITQSRRRTKMYFDRDARNHLVQTKRFWNRIQQKDDLYSEKSVIYASRCRADER